MPSSTALRSLLSRRRGAVHFSAIARELAVLPPFAAACGCTSVLKAGAYPFFIAWCPRAPAAAPNFSPNLDFKRMCDLVVYHRTNIANRKASGDIDRVVTQYRAYTHLLQQAAALRQERNSAAKSPPGTSGGGEGRDKARQLKEKLAVVEAELSTAKAALLDAGLAIPCESHPSSPIGPESNARTMALHGQKPSFSFQPLDHLALGKRLALFDFAASATMSGSGFVVLRNDGVLLEQALVRWALDHAMAAGFSAIAPPELVYPWLVEACGFNPRLSPAASSGDGTGIGASSSLSRHPGAADAAAASHTASQVYSIANADLALIGTSEIAIAGMHVNSILDADAVPAMYTAVSHCFRREASARGVRDKGLYRLHQFTKVELFSFIAPSAAEPPPTGVPLEGSGPADGSPAATPPNPASEAMFERMVALQVGMFSELGLHFRVLDMPTEELGAAAYRKFDIEAWMPCRGEHGEGEFGEISSASNCMDYQSRRLNIRYRVSPNNNQFVHTLNATACAIPRVMLAILETHQQADGSVVIPPALRAYMGGRERLEPRKVSTAVEPRH